MKDRNGSRIMVDSKEKLSDYEEFKQFIRDSFIDGRVNCELRLSDAEVKYIQDNYPYSTFSPLSKKSERKNWYIVCLGSD